MKRRLRILYLVSEFMYTSQVRNLVDLVTGIDKDRFEVEIGALDIGDEATHLIEELNVPYYWLPVHPPRGLEPRRLWRFLTSPLFLRRRHYDLVHSLLYQSIFTESFIVRALTNAKFVFTKTNLQWDNHRLNWYLKSLFADRIISVSGATDEVLIKHGFKNKIVRGYLGIDTEHFKRNDESRRKMRNELGIRDDSFVFGCAAQYMELKDHPTLIRAFEKLAGDNEQLFLLLCGQNHRDDYYRRVKEQMAASEYSNRIIDLGVLSDMPSFYSALDCFVFSSYWDALPYVLSEAASCSLPVVACRIHGPIDMIVDGETGQLCRPSDPSDMADKMLRYATSPQLAKRHGVQGRERAVAVFSKEAMVRDCEKLYRDLVGS